jgi:predicted amidohydrolase YtcJ
MRRPFVLLGGSILTMDRGRTTSTALAVLGDRIIAVGDRDHVLGVAGEDVDVVDVEGRTVLPGFTDNHIHLANSWQRVWVDLSYPRCTSITEIVEVMAEEASRRPAHSWVIGRGFESERLAEGRAPNRFDLDARIPEHRVGLCNREGMGWTFNTLGLRAIGVQDDTPDPPGGPLERDDAGRPLGPMWDNARTAFIVPNTPKPSDDDLVAGYKWIEDELLRSGVTTAHEAGYKEARHVRAWNRVRAERPVGVRVVFGPYPLVGSEWDDESAPGRLFRSGLATGFGSSGMRLGAVQMGVDGGLIGRTAALFEPYSDRPDGYKGSFRVTQETLDRHVAEADQLGWQVGLICQGDAGIDRSLRAIRAAAGSTGHRLEHAYLWAEHLIDQAAALDVVWNTQPSLLPITGRYLTRMFGERARWAFPFGSALAAGVTISGGSDWPVGPIDPMIGIDALVNRPVDLTGNESFHDEERVSLLDALWIYTAGGARAGLFDRDTGSIEVGKLADFVVLDRDITSTDPSRIRDVRVQQTYVGGDLLYDSGRSEVGVGA